MLKVGITGGIGSGKSVVCQVFSTLGIPVFSADDAARYLMENDTALKENIKLLLGKEAYKNGTPDRAVIASIVFADPAKLELLNELVHPATISFSNRWMLSQQTPYVIKEAAIFFESGSNKEMDVMIGVAAPPELRIKRVILRSHLTRTEVLARVARQMDQDEKMKLCDYVVNNDEVNAIVPQVLAIHKKLLSI